MGKISLNLFVVLIREVCKNEYVIPLGQELKDMYEDPEMGNSLRILQMESVRPQMKTSEIT